MGIFGAITRKVELLFFAAVGVGFIILGYVVFMHGYNHMEELKNKNSSYVETMATIVGHDENSKRLQAVIVEYTVDGVKYKGTSDIYQSTYQEVGTQVKIKYNPANPEEVIWREDVSKNDLIIMGAGGLLAFFGLGCALLNLSNILKPDPYRRYAKMRQAMANVPVSDGSVENKSLVEIACERRVGVFDPNQGTTSPYVEPYYNQPGNTPVDQSNNNGNNSVL